MRLRGIDLLILMMFTKSNRLDAPNISFKPLKKKKTIPSVSLFLCFTFQRAFDFDGGPINKHVVESGLKLYACKWSTANLLSGIKHKSTLNRVDVLFVPAFTCVCACVCVCACSWLTGRANGLWLCAAGRVMLIKVNWPTGRHSHYTVITLSQLPGQCACDSERQNTCSIHVQYRASIEQ